jgi:hypothetical protein
MREPGRVSTNLAQQTYEFYVGRHSTAWPAAAPGPAGNGSPVAAAPGAPGTQPTLAGTSALVPPPGTPRPDLFFPSSDSIPPVNIMTAEPAAQPENTGSTPPVRTPPRRPAEKKEKQAPAKAQPKQAPVELANPSGAPPAPQ